MPEDTVEEIATKRAAFERLHTGASWLNLKTACDCYIAAFFSPKTGGVPGSAELAKPSMPLTDHVWSAARGQDIYGPLVTVVDKIANAIGAFHWPIEFPDILARGGFNAVVGNPPWERIKLQEQEFFAARSPAIAMAQNKAAREKLIKELEKADPDSADARLYADFQFAKRTAEAASEFAHNSGRYPLTGAGDVNTYALFAEHFARLARSEGRSGIIVPTGIATDSSTSAFFGDLVARKRLVQLIDFENREKLFPAVDSRMKFCVLAMGAADRANFAFFLTNPVQLDEAERRFTLTAAQIARINPNTKTAPVFRSRADAELTVKIYSKTPVLFQDTVSEPIDPWQFSYQTKMFDMTDASYLFSSSEHLQSSQWTRDNNFWCRGFERQVPLYEAKMIYYFDHRWATYSNGSIEDEDSARDATLAEKKNPTYEPDPRYWVPESEFQLRAARVPSALKRAYREKNANRCVKAIAEWLVGYFHVIERRRIREADITSILGRERPWRVILGKPMDKWLIEPKTTENGMAIQFDTPLTLPDIEFIKEGPVDAIDMSLAIITRMQPRWEMGWRGITNATNERSAVFAVFPNVGVGNSIKLCFLGKRIRAQLAAAFISCQSSLTLDFVARNKIGGTNFNMFIAKQFPVPGPDTYSADDLSFIVPRVLELTYTSYSMHLWAEDLGHSGPPFAWDEDRRAALRAELDAFFARRYGLTRDELRYVLDPADVKGADYPSETFRGLKKNEEARFGEYRTQRLVLQAFDRLTGV